ncbi:fungal specific transcription factor domain-containing protein [Diaporthe amygdali]|uniref:fungal specific transcription factor domain-containing protein n=1 Tax=Phomopsis amygdali TaxID=1214568 RepID=UPI0022FEA4C5|nr:fungal specific transcription factor domain-containing protein [Diaporthe amygdali]KAJ0119486.1 fungal specific transcription factor domain-containing protein [Diaporthe amygdali]
MAGAGVGPGAATATTQRHPSQSAGSSVSAVGSNSAHPSPLSFGPNHNAQPARNLNPSVSTPGAGPAPSAAAHGGGAAAAAGAKRKLSDTTPDDASQRQQRSKRNRYISIACNECKRRKIKCNGETPCQRCGNLNLNCQYAPNCCSNNFKDSDEFREMRDNVTRLQEQVNTLFQNMNALKQETLHLAPIQDRALPLPSSAGVTPSPSTATMSSVHRQDVAPSRAPLLFRGPTSASFTVDVAKNTLHNMRKEYGWSGPEAVQDNGDVIDDSCAPSPYPPWLSAADMPRARPQDPLWGFDRAEMIRLCRVHEEEVGIMYPVVNINNVVKHANFLANWMESSSKHGLVPQGIGQDEGITDIKTLELKIIMCCALVVEGNGYSEKGLRLWESIQARVDRMLMSDKSEIRNLPFLALVGGYRFLSHDEALAWRVMGQVARLCFELGIHRRDVIEAMEDEQERKNAINTFWSAYVLDRRWSFGTGFPFVVHDDKIDPRLPYPDEFPYLKSMITFSKLGAKVWKLVDYFNPILLTEMRPRDFEELDQEILAWYDAVPEEIKIDGFKTQIPIPGTSTYDIDRLQIWTRLRLNQIRIWLYTPVLHSSESIQKNPEHAQRVVDLAKETIQYLSLLNTHTDVYRRIQVFYNHFLTSAIACLFLASTHAPWLFSAQCREEFNMSMMLIEDMSAKSHVSQRLWSTIKELKAYVPGLGRQDDDPRLREHAALTMAGMARMSRGGQPPPDPLLISNRHGSISSASAGYQPTPSPGLTPGLGGRQNLPPSRMGSLTPHAGRRSPHDGGASGVQGQDSAGLDGETLKNGILLRMEMSKMFEALSNGVGLGAQPHSDGDDSFTGSPNEYSAGGHWMPYSDDGVYPRMKMMF